MRELHHRNDAQRMTPALKPLMMQPAPVVRAGIRA
jgi:hypothetical protein